MVSASPRRRVQFDLLATDADGEPVLVAEVKRHPRAREDATQQLQAYLAMAGIRYGLVVDPDLAEFFELTDAPSIRSLLKVPTEQILTAYAHGLDPKKLSESYLVTLVDTWLRNIMQPLDSDPPPAYERLVEVGLADRLRDGHAAVEWSGSF